jgi:hypothetical protein
MIHETGYLINADTSSITVRTFEPYHLIKTNSDRLSRGDSVRVMSTSQNSTANTVCDNPNDFSTYNQRFYYSKFDNPYALTQLQDNIRERNQMLTLEARDIDIFTFNANLNYHVKFYSKDDETGSGSYRLKKYAAYFGFTRSGVKSRVETSSVFEFGNIPELRENGVTAPRKTYAEKVGSTNKSASNSTTLKGATSSGTGGGFTSNSANTPSVPFKTNFRNKKDYLGNTVPETIPASYKMSQQVKFEDVYVTQVGTDLYKGSGLANNFAYFINAQRFASEVLDPLFNSEGKSKLVDFYNTHPEFKILNIKPIQKNSVVHQYLLLNRNITQYDNLYQAEFKHSDKWIEPVVLILNKHKNLILGMQIRNLKEDKNKRFYKIYDFGMIYNDMFPNEQLDEFELLNYNKLSHFFNILNVDFSKPVTIFEGYFDSYFFPNSIGVIGTNTDLTFLLKDDSLDIRFFYDNDKAGYNEAIKQLNNGYKVFLWRLLFKNILKKLEVCKVKKVILQRKQNKN